MFYEINHIKIVTETSYNVLYDCKGDLNSSLFPHLQLCRSLRQGTKLDELFHVEGPNETAQLCHMR